MSILVVGSVAYDSIETVSECRERQLGGSASYFSIAASRFASVRAVGVVGDDFSQSDLDLLISKGVDISGIERAEGKTFAWSGRYHQDMIERDTLSTELGVFETFQPVLPDSWAESPYVLLANIHPALQLDVLSKMNSSKLVILDTMNLWIKNSREELISVLSDVDVLLVNDSEAKLLSGKESLADAASSIQMMGPEKVVIKKGEHGALLFCKDSVLSVPAIILPKVIDPTGSGDSFAGGFIGHLAEIGADRDSDDSVFRQAMVSATAVASHCPEAFSVDGLLEMDEKSYQDRRNTLLAMMIP
jgi:sugar/nucleoside kinase (ribokinase family)